MVGDRWLDVADGAARSARAGFSCAPATARTEEQRPPEGVRADAIVDNLIEAVGWILRNPEDLGSELEG